MAKGSLFVGSGTGKVGNLVLANTKSGQVTRAYQPKVSNPKTRAQMLQRAKFANAVKFFKQSVANFYKFAYEDKAKNESDYNAFMRHNIRVSLPMSREQYLEPSVPALGNRFIMSAGRIALPGAVSVDKHVAITIPGLAAATTVGALSTALIAAGLQAGDIFTLVQITTPVTADNLASATEDGSNFEVPKWTIAQFIIDESSTDTLADVKGVGQFATSGKVTLVVDADAHTLGITGDGDASVFGAAIVTRNLESGLQASNSELMGNTTAQALVAAVSSDAAIESSLLSWGSNGTVILKGSIANG